MGYISQLGAYRTLESPEFLERNKKLRMKPMGDCELDVCRQTEYVH